MGRHYPSWKEAKYSKDSQKETSQKETNGKRNFICFYIIHLKQLFKITIFK